MDRKHLPDSRAATVRRVVHTDDKDVHIDIYVIVGFFEPYTTESRKDPNLVEQPGEVFIKLAKEGSTLGGMCDMLGITMSLMLQYGIPWSRIAIKMRNTNFDPVDGNGKSIAHSIVTAVDKILSDRGSLPDKGCYL